jgi:hypothetical protein
MGLMAYYAETGHSHPLNRLTLQLTLLYGENLKPTSATPIVELISPKI